MSEASEELARKYKSFADVDITDVIAAAADDWKGLSYPIRRVTDWGPIYMHKVSTQEEYDAGIPDWVYEKAKETGCTHVMIHLPKPMEKR